MVDSDRSTRYEEMSSSGEVQGRRLRRAAAQENASGKAGIPVKGEMTVKELKQHGFIYFEDGLWRRDVLLWRDCCGSAVEHAGGGASSTCLCE